jgi:hypothetical protein
MANKLTKARDMALYDFAHFIRAPLFVQWADRSLLDTPRIDQWREKSGL